VGDFSTSRTPGTLSPHLDLVSDMAKIRSGEPQVYESALYVGSLSRATACRSHTMRSSCRPGWSRRMFISRAFNAGLVGIGGIEDLDSGGELCAEPS
jgi:hypothetical protein